jgi:hypothetical protein
LEGCAEQAAGGGVKLTIFKAGGEYWLHVQAHPVINDKARASFARKDEDLRVILLYQEQRRCAAARKRLGAADVTTSTRRR